MNPYKIIFWCSDGQKNEVIVDAANRIMAFEIFKELGYEDVVEAYCYRMLDEEDGNENLDR